MEKSTLKKLAIITISVLIGLFAMLGMLVFNNYFGSPFYRNEKLPDNYISYQIKIDEKANVAFGLNLNINAKSFASNENELDIFKEKIKSMMDESLTGQIQEFEENRQDDKYSYKIEKPEWMENDSISYQIIFPSIVAFDYYCDQVSFHKNDNFLMTILKFNFSSKIFEKVKDENFLNGIYDCAKGMSFEEKLKQNFQPNFFIEFSSKVRRANSNGDYFIASDGFYSHICKVRNENKKTSFNITLNFIYPGWWYLLGITIPLAIMALAIIVCIAIDYLIKKRGKKVESRGDRTLN